MVRKLLLVLVLAVLLHVQTAEAVYLGEFTVSDGYTLEVVTQSRVSLTIQAVIRGRLEVVDLLRFDGTTTPPPAIVMTIPARADRVILSADVLQPGTTSGSALIRLISGGDRFEVSLGGTSSPLHEELVFDVVR